MVRDPPYALDLARSYLFGHRQPCPHLLSSSPPCYIPAHQVMLARSNMSLSKSDPPRCCRNDVIAQYLVCRDGLCRIACLLVCLRGCLDHPTRFCLLLSRLYSNATKRSTFYPGQEQGEEEDFEGSSTCCSTHRLRGGYWGDMFMEGVQVVFTGSDPGESRLYDWEQIRRDLGTRERAASLDVIAVGGRWSCGRQKQEIQPKKCDFAATSVSLS